jgi:hypothetical protein
MIGPGIQASHQVRSGWQTAKHPMDRRKHTLKLLRISDNILRFKNKETKLYEKTTEDCENHIFQHKLQVAINKTNDGPVMRN